MSKTPECKKCGSRHLNFKPCPSAYGSYTGPTPPGFRVIRGGKDSIFPVPEGFRDWSNVKPFSQWKPRDDGPEAA